MEQTISETHRKTIDGGLLGAGPNQLTLVFTHAPDIPEGYTGVLKLVHPRSSIIAREPLPGGKSGLGIMIEKPVLSVDDQILQQVQRANGFSTHVAYKTVIQAQTYQFANSVAQQFFRSAAGIEPKLYIRFQDNAEGSSPGVEHIRILMTGQANHHPFWQVPSV